ncbi:hypothetical protein [Flavobacterium salmonis]|uniref:Uncharacterized protein n=1 Tax=Flavobacterium salmonis TaxID=2654844 RepID=A0A6V6YS87_9FLAO|nr:hypothetical protein [Flavobacterium salmonis]CAD0001552.1 hypothetical protein FLAT13_00643 [Flavobacterium salmonis]
MIKQKLENILSLNGISILIGIVGGVFGIISVFIDWETQLSIKWFAALWIVYSFVLIISIKLTYDISKTHSLKRINSKILQFSRANLLLLAENNNNLEFSQTVSIYYIKDNFQLFFANGYVQNIQEKLVQIKIISFDEDFTTTHDEEYSRILNNESNALSSLLINNYLRYNG